MRIIQVAAEAYPFSKTGGLGDVMGALPKYLTSENQEIHLVLPYYSSAAVTNSEWELVFAKNIFFGMQEHSIHILKRKSEEKNVYNYLVEIPFIFPRDKVYGYDDDDSRYLLFQIAVLYWLSDWKEKIDIVHCHDYHTGFIPFMMKYVYDFQILQNIPTVYTIHNGEYSGETSLELEKMFPQFQSFKSGFLEYNNALNPSVSALKCAYAVTTVSEGYLEELEYSDTAIGYTIRSEKEKSKGILNGIDDDFWNPNKDHFLSHNYHTNSYKKGKSQNKKELLKETDLKTTLPLISFIGRMVKEKGADLLPSALDMFLLENDKVNFFILGSGDQSTVDGCQALYERYPNNVQVYFGYNEALAHQVYASSDFLLMPSRVEPCGLNQMYAMRYGTIPIVRATGGLKDTVKPIEDGGNGFTFLEASAHELYFSIKRALQYSKENDLGSTIKKNMKTDFSWKKSAKKYVELYESLNSSSHEL